MRRLQVADRVGQQFGNYRLVSLLGQGGYAEVYLGQHVRLSLQAAIKVLHAYLTGSEAEHFYQEAETIAKLTHPSIVRVLDFDLQDGVPFLVMDYAPNGSLRRRYSKGTVVPLPQIVSSVKQVAAALQYAHEQKFIHRDVKPENMLVGRREEVLLSDFGLAALAHSTGSLSAQEAVGTLPYMAPEQIEGHPRAASDQYALAVVVYEWLCGARPFEGSVSEVMVQHLSMPPPPLQERVSTISPEVEQVVLRALAKDPQARFPSVQDFSLALEGACRGEAWSGYTLPVLSSAFPAQDRHAGTHTLPAPLTPFIGREREVALVCKLLRRQEVRLLTLTGPGGIGKTRLGLQVAAELSDVFPNGVYFVNLAPISDPALVMPAIAQALALKETPGQPLLDLVQAFLRDKRLLLLLDNFEQVSSAAVPLVELLAACPQLKVLVTSRVVLHVQGEQEVAVPPLSMPDPRHLPDLAALAQYEAVALFLERAQTTKPDFHLTAANARTIVEICTRLDGLPLAIELAVTRIKLLPPQALLARLSSRLAVLTGATRDAPARQQTLRTTIEWSYDLLNAAEQRLFRLLSVFVGGCTLEAVEAVCEALGDERGKAFDGVASLIDKSLVQQSEQEDEEPRLVMLETIREYGLEALAARGEVKATRQAHAAYYLALVEAVEPRLISAEQVQWLAQLEREHGNLQAALSWLITSEERELALRFGGALWQFWRRHGHLSEGYGFLERVLAAPEAAVAPIRAKALIGAGVLSGELGNYTQAEILCEEGLRLPRELKDPRGVITSLWMLGRAAYQKSEYAVARTLVEEAIAVAQQVESSWEMTHALDTLAFVAYFEGRYKEACVRGEECLVHARRAGDNKAIRNALWILGMAYFSAGNRMKGVTLLEEECALAHAAGDERDLAWALVFLGGLSTCFLDAGASGRTLLEEGLMHARRVGDQEVIGWAGYWKASDAFIQADYPAARALLEECLTLARRWGSHRKLLLVRCLELLGEVAAAQGEPVWATRLWGAAETMRTSSGLSIPPGLLIIYEQFTASVCTRLGEEAFNAALAEGRTMTPEQALEAQQLLPPIPSRQPAVSVTKEAAPSPDRLTTREVEVLHLLAQGLTDAQIAEQLVISPRTVNAHLTSIYSKIHVSSRAAATRYAIEHHLI
jgi:predicted ATPase/DNA-binding CsgD family transcriptional regulator